MPNVLFNLLVAYCITSPPKQIALTFKAIYLMPMLCFISFQCIASPPSFIVEWSTPTIPMCRVSEIKTHCSCDSRCYSHVSLVLFLFNGLVMCNRLILLYFCSMEQRGIEFGANISPEAAVAMPPERPPNNAQRCSQQASPFLGHGWWFWWVAVAVPNVNEEKSRKQCLTR